MKPMFAFVVPGAILSSAAQAQKLGGGESADVSLIRVFLALIVCLVLAALAILLVRQRLSGRSSRLLPRLASRASRLRLVESRRISPHAELALVEADDREYLLVLGAGGTLLLREQAVISEPEA